MGELILVTVLAMGCGQEAPQLAEDEAPSTTATAVTLPTSDPQLDQAPTATQPRAFAFTQLPWHDPEDDPPWETVSLGLPGSTHLRIGYGPLGFFSVNNVSRGAVVGISSDGVTWRETAILTGPDGEEQVSVADMVTSDSEYLVVAETWTNEVPGPEVFRYALWRSPDGVNWTVTDLGMLDPNARASSIVTTPEGVVLAGTIYDIETGSSIPRVWLETPSGEWVDLSAGVALFDLEGWLGGAVSNGEGLIAWGSSRDGDNMLIWFTEDLQNWTRASLVATGNSRLAGVTAFRGGYVAVESYSRTWVSPDGAEWFPAATPTDFATDAVSPGWATFRKLFTQDGFLVALASVGYHSSAEWCYLDPNDCAKSVTTVLVSSDAKEWRRIPLPGEFDQPDHPIEADAVLVDGRIAVLHSQGDTAVLSTLDRVAGPQILNTGEAPDLPFAVAKPGDEIEMGVRYGYPINTHCGFPDIGPLNGTVWVLDEAIELPRDISPGPASLAFGFIELTDDETLSYIVDDRLIARYRPDPEAQPGGCY